MKKLFSILALVCAIVFMSSCSAVDSSEVGIKFKKFALTEQGTLKAVPVTGFVFYNPFTTSVYTYPVTVQRVDYQAFSVKTKDGSRFMMDPILAYRIDRDNAIKVFAKYRKPLRQLEKEYIMTSVYNAYRIVADTYSSDELLGQQGQFEADVDSLLRISLGSEGFFVEEFTSQIVPPEELQQSINEKNRAIQTALKAENEVKEAEAKAKIKVAQAEGEAQAMKIKADAEAYYNKTIAESLSPLIVQEDWIEKWDGKLPEYATNGGGTAVPFMNIGK